MNEVVPAPPQLPGLTVEDSARINAYAQAAMPANTRRAYQAAIQQWRRWAAKRELPALPAPPAQLAAYFTERAAHWKPSTLNVHCAGLRWWHRRMRQPNPFADPDLELVLRGIRRTHAAMRQQARPIRMRELVAVIPAIDVSTPRGLRDRALLLIGWWGAMRRSELTDLRLEDLLIEDEGLRVTIRRAKTDQEGEGAHLALALDPTGELCPVEAWQTWRQELNTDARPVFRPIDRWDNIASTALTGTSVSAIVSARARDVGLTGSFSGHSLRAGFITEAAQRGIPEWQIMQHSRHKSVAVVRGYVRQGALWTDALTRRLMQP